MDVKGKDNGSGAAREQTTCFFEINANGIDTEYSKSYNRLLVRGFLIAEDISQNIKSLPVETTHIRQAISEEQVKQLLNNCQNSKERLIIALAIILKR